MKVIVVGGGASGLMAAGRAAACGASVTLLEKMPRLGLKLGITGKGRCNVTNTGTIEDYIANFAPDGRFLTNAFHRFFHPDLTDFLTAGGVPTAVERGQRVFPASNRALDVVSALLRFTKKYGVSVVKGCAVKKIRVEKDRVSGLDTSNGYFAADRVILATGGASYPQTGSTGDGYYLARELGHTITPLRPYLVPLCLKEPYVRDLQGLALKNVRVSLYARGEKVDEEFGEMLFTHFGVSGPIILSLSRTAVNHLDQGQVEIALCLKPALEAKVLDERLKRELHAQAKRQFKNILLSLLPRRLAAIVPTIIAIPAEKKGGEITRAERIKLARFLHDWRLKVTGTRPLAEAIVTAGGVLTKEINPFTMESKKIQGLYFCGEIMDVQAKTGGYNLQMAFTTGWVAGESAATS